MIDKNNKFKIQSRFEVPEIYKKKEICDPLLIIYWI